MKYFSLWYLFALECFYKREILCISCSLQVFTAGTVLLKGSGKGMAQESLYLPRCCTVLTAVEISSCPGPVPESCLNITSSAQSIIPLQCSFILCQLSQAYRDGTNLLALLKMFSCALEMGCFSLPGFHRGHRVVGAAVVDGLRWISGVGSTAGYHEPFHLIFTWKMLSLNLIPAL